MQRITRFAFASLLLLVSGCGVTLVSLAPTVRAPPTPVTGGDVVAVAGRAEAVPDTIGYGTITVFAIPASPVRFSDPDAAERIMHGLREALRAAGYRPVTPPEPPQGPVLTCRIKEMRFKNYTWLMPLIQTWGRIRLTLALTDPPGAVRWQKDYEERYRKGGVGESFDEAVNVVMGKILARAAEDFTTREFRTACCDTTSPGSRTVGSSWLTSRLLEH